jgi:hypothetical protein
MFALFSPPPPPFFPFSSFSLSSALFFFVPLVFLPFFRFHLFNPPLLTARFVRLRALLFLSVSFASISFILYARYRHSALL